jgi:hypothetical protein
MPTRDWEVTSPGVLSLLGTEFRVVFDINSGGDFVVYQGDRFRLRVHDLWSAKRVAEAYQTELEEMGLG